MIVGIDLGTTNSLVAAFRNGKAELIPNALGEYLTPSVVGLGNEGRIIIGAAARERLVTHPELTTANFKRYMGTRRSIALGTHLFRPEELSALVLKSLKADAEAYLGETVTEAVITVPAYFSDAQRKATKAAGELAGLKVERLLNEPTAAAMAYGLHQKSDQRFLVFDLGGGTFDVSILELFDGIMEVHASAGDNYLGGEDFTEALGQYFLKQNASVLGQDADAIPRPLMKTIHAQAERAKRRLSEHKDAEMQVTVEGKALSQTISAETFENLCAGLLDRIAEPIRKALRDAKTRSRDLDEIILVGGSSRMPVIRQLATRLFGRFPSTHLHPDEVIAMGAAIQAGLKRQDEALKEVVMTDVSPFTLGVEIMMDTGSGQRRPGHYMPIIERNTSIPCSRVERVFTCHDNQKILDVRIYQGENPLVKDNVFLGNLTVDIPPAEAGKESGDIRFTYDINGILEAEVTINSTSKKTSLVIEGNPGVLSPAEIRERLAALATLKLHPREKMENQFLLSRAERLYQELLGTKRSHVGSLIAQFNQALDSQDEHALKRFRAELREKLDSIEHSH